MKFKSARVRVTAKCTYISDVLFDGPQKYVLCDFHDGKSISINDVPIFFSDDYPLYVKKDKWYVISLGSLDRKDIMIFGRLDEV